MCDHRLEATACSKCEYQTKIPKLLYSEPSRQSFEGDTFTISQVLNLCSPCLLLFHETLSDNMGTAHMVNMSSKPLTGDHLGFDSCKQPPTVNVNDH